MGMGGPSGKGGLSADINVTPLVDVCLVILIIFMVVVPYIVNGPPVTLPKAGNSETMEDAKNALNLSMTGEGRLFMGEKPMPLPQAAEALGQAHLKDAASPVRFQGDRRLTFGDIEGVLKAVQGAGFKSMALMVQKTDEAPEGGAP